MNYLDYLWIICGLFVHIFDMIVWDYLKNWDHWVFELFGLFVNYCRLFLDCLWIICFGLFAKWFEIICRLFADYLFWIILNYLTVCGFFELCIHIHICVQSPSPSGRPQAQLAYRGCRLRPRAGVRLLLSNFKELIEGRLMILSCLGPGPAWNATRMHCGRRQPGSVTVPGSLAGPAHLPMNSQCATDTACAYWYGFSLRAYSSWHGFFLALAYALRHGFGQYDTICTSNVARL